MTDTRPKSSSAEQKLGGSADSGCSGMHKCWAAAGKALLARAAQMRQGAGRHLRDKGVVDPVAELPGAKEEGTLQWVKEAQPA